MKIGIVCFNLDWHAGGPRLIFSMARALVKEGHDVIIYAPEFTGKYFKELWSGLDIRVVSPPKKLEWTGRPKNIFQKIKRKIQQDQAHILVSRTIALAMDADFDVVNVHDYAYPVGYFYKKRNLETDVVWTENDPPYAYLPKPTFLYDLASRAYNIWKDKKSKKFFRFIDGATVLDMYNMEWCDRRGIPTHLVRPGLDFDNFYQPVRDVEKRFLKKKVQLMGLGSLNKYRRYEDIILAVKKLRDDGYDASAVIVCSNSWNEDEYRDYLIDLVSQNDLGAFVTLMFEGAPNDELRQIQKESSIFVYSLYLPPPRDGYGFSVGVMEAIAAGLPTVLCRTTTCCEVLEDGETALIVDPMAPHQIAERVKDIVDDPQQYKKIANNGQSFIRENFSWEKYSRQLLEVVVKEKQ